MDEMTLLREFRMAVAPPDQERLAAVRAGLVRAAQGAPGALDKPALTRPPRRNRERSPRRRWPWLVIVGTAAAAIAGLFAANGLGHRPAGETMSASSLLQRAALAAFSEPMPTGRYISIGTDLYQATGPGHHVLIHLQEWESADKAQPAILRETPCYTFGSSRTCAYTQEPSGEPSTYAGLNALPATPAAVLSYIEHHNGTTPGSALSLPEKEWWAIYSLLQTTPALPPRIGGVVFQLAAQIPGVTVIPHTANPAGASGIAAVMTSLGVRTELIFDPGTYRLTGEEAIATLPTGLSPVGSGSILQASSIGPARFVGSAPATRLAGGCQTNGPFSACGSGSGSSSGSGSG